MLLLIRFNFLLKNSVFLNHLIISRLITIFLSEIRADL